MPCLSSVQNLHVCMWFSCYTIGDGSRGARGARAPLSKCVGGAQGGTVLWQASDLLMLSHVVKFDGSVALVYALHDLPFDFSLLQLKKSCKQALQHSE